MILHVVLFRPKADLPVQDRAAIVADLKAAASGIPGIRRLQIGRRVRHGQPGYEQAMREDFEFALVVEFDDVDGLVTYLNHPAHVSLGRHFALSADAALAYDYKIVGLADLSF